MTIETRRITVSRIPVELVRKEIENLHLGVYPPDGRVRIAVPVSIDDKAVRLAVIEKLKWIKRQQARFKSQARESKREMTTGESHYVFGTRYRLQIIHRSGVPCVRIRNRSRLELYVRPEANADQRRRILQCWYRDRLKEAIPPLLKKWQSILDSPVSHYRIKRMKTKWGACNTEAHRIWINLELAKKPVQCLEYVIAHELAHFIERYHNDRFVAILDRHLPQWRLRRAELNSAPLAHEHWNKKTS